VSAQHPLLAATLPTGERIQFVVPPAVTRDTVSITVRKPCEIAKDLDDLEREGLFDRLARAGGQAGPATRPHEALLRDHQAAGRWAQFLRLAVRHRRTIVVSGQTGSGKTTLMKALLRDVDARERLITIEDTAELALPAHPNAVHLFYSKDAQGVAQVTPQSLLEACLRMKPDRILLAELRGPECFSFVRLAASGHPGSITSVHAGSCELAFEQMSLMIRQSPAGAGLRADEVQRLLRLVIDVVVQFDRDAQGRFLSEVHYAPQYTPQDALHDAPHNAPRQAPLHVAGSIR
jgi:type IV secretion system protein VirB11